MLPSSRLQIRRSVRITSADVVILVTQMSMAGSLWEDNRKGGEIPPRRLKRPIHVEN
jgi:hypothetical protein